MRKKRRLSSASPCPITTAHSGCAPRGCSSSLSTFWGACVPRAVLGGRHGWWRWSWVLGVIGQQVWDVPRGRRGGQGDESPVIPPRPSLSHRVGRSGGDSLSYQWSCLDGNKICTERHENGVNKRDKNGTIKPATSPPLIKKRERGEERGCAEPLKRQLLRQPQP